MRIFLAGAAGAVGRRLVPILRAAGHEVVGTTTSESKVELVRAAGAEPVVLDALDGAAVRKAVEQARPDVVVHELTALSGPANVKKPDESFALTNRLRTEAIDHLIAAARSVGAKRLIAQSFTGWPNPRTGSWVKTEDDGLDPQPVT
ncbi:MAG: NAD-dependent epimerase/dehydratase family protein, partial [Acidimicrobiales bacterium]